ncbi:cytospin-A-like [Xenentodon cancila]
MGLSCKCVSIRELSMKKSVRAAASKVSGDRGKPEAVAAASTGKSSSKSVIAAPLPKVKSNDDLLAAMAGGNPTTNSSVTKTKKTASIGTSASNLDGKPKMSARDSNSFQGSNFIARPSSNSQDISC